MAGRSTIILILRSGWNAAELMLILVGLPACLAAYWIAGTEALRWVFGGALAVAVVMGAVAGNMAWRRRVERERVMGGLCPACGYDLRASGDRCPECGRRRGLSMEL